MNLERHIKTALLLVSFVALCAGCDTDSEKSVTGSLLYRNTGNLEQFTIISDSIEVSKRYVEKLGKKSSSLAGTYGNITAGSVFKFRRPEQTMVDSLVSASITFSVNDAWNDGSLAFALYNTTDDWEDSAAVDPGLLSSAAEIIATYDISDIADSTVAALTFDIDIAVIQSWDTYGAVLLENTDTGRGMVSVSTDNSTSSPALELVRSISGILDSTTVRSREGTYYIESNPPFESGTNYIGDGYPAGFALDINLADFNPPPTSIHKCTLYFTVTESLLHGNSMPIVIQLLAAPFSPPEDAVIEAGSSIDVTITPDNTMYSVDISPYIERWHNFDTIDHGILFKSFYSHSSPNYVVIEPPDSLVIEYTTIPEVE